MSADPSVDDGSNVNAPSGPHTLVVREVRLTLHNMYDMPEAMVLGEGANKVFELVLKPVVKMYYHDQRVTHMDLQSRTLTFTTQDIVYRNDRFQLDFAAMAKARSGRSSPQRLSAAAAAGAGVPGGGCSSGSVRNSMSDGHVSNSTTTTTTVGGGGVGIGDYGGCGDVPFNEMLIQFPSRGDLKSIIEVSVGVRERHAHSTSTRWLTTALDSSAKQSDIANFASAEGEVVRHKIVMRFVGLLVGHLSCSLSLPYVTADIRHVHVPADHGTVPQAFTDGLVLSIVDRLEKDQRRLQKLYRPKNPVQIVSRPQLEAALMRGDSEWTLYRSLLLEYDPEYFLKRVQKILDLYPPTPQHLPWVQQSAASLVEQHADKELQLIRDLSAELGPELNSISPRTRRLVFGWFYHSPKREDLVKCVRDRYSNQVNVEDFLDNEPDLYMEALCARYGPELTPTRYYFPMIEYIADNRRYFRSVLQRCTQTAMDRAGGATANRHLGVTAASTTGSSGDGLSPASALPQYLLELTPHERPLQMPGGSAASGNEIDILSHKYAEQFQFLTEPIAAAITEVIGDASSARADAQGLPAEFSVFESETPQPAAHIKDMVRRCGMYTYISPSTLLATLIFLDRLCLRYPKLVLTAYNIRHLFTTMARVASKVVDLRSINNKNFARVFDLRLYDFNVMEDHLLKLMQFDFMLTPEEFNDYASLIRCPASGISAASPATAAVAAAAAAAAAVGSRPGTASGLHPGASTEFTAPRQGTTTTTTTTAVMGSAVIDAVITEDGASPARAESVPASARLISGRRASASTSSQPVGMTSTTTTAAGVASSGLAQPPSTASTVGRRQPPLQFGVASSYDATSRMPSRLASSSSARPAVGMSAQYEPRRNNMIETPDLKNGNTEI